MEQETPTLIKYKEITNKEESEPLKENEEKVKNLENSEIIVDNNNNNNNNSLTVNETLNTTTTSSQMNNLDINNNFNSNSNLINNANKPKRAYSISSSSKSSLSSSQTLMCRICHCEESSEEYLISPCHCTGTLRYVHQACLQQWLKSNGMKSCELCKFEFIMQTKIRPLKNWQKLDMNRIEKRKIFCSVAFHLIAITCVIWSLYVLIDRTADEIRKGHFGQWPFWTKIVVVAIGFTGGIVFMYIQCKMYLQLCIKWKQYNRVIIIQPINEDLLRKHKKLSKNQQQQNQLGSKIINAFKLNKLINKDSNSTTTTTNVNNNNNNNNNQNINNSINTNIINTNSNNNSNLTNTNNIQTDENTHFIINMNTNNVANISNN